MEFDANIQEPPLHDKRVCNKRCVFQLDLFIVLLQMLDSIFLSHALRVFDRRRKDLLDRILFGGGQP